jgi:hypothetical protein
MIVPINRLAVLAFVKIYITGLCCDGYSAIAFLRVAWGGHELAEESLVAGRI